MRLNARVSPLGYIYEFIKCIGLYDNVVLQKVILHCFGLYLSFKLHFHKESISLEFVEKQRDMWTTAKTCLFHSLWSPFKLHSFELTALHLRTILSLIITKKKTLKNQHYQTPKCLIVGTTTNKWQWHHHQELQFITKMKITQELRNPKTTLIN